MIVQYVGPHELAPKGKISYDGFSVEWRMKEAGEDVLYLTTNIPKPIAEYICDGTEHYVPYEPDNQQAPEAEQKKPSVKKSRSRK